MKHIKNDTAVGRVDFWFSEIDDGMVRWWVKRGARALRGLRERLWERYTVSPRSTFEFYDDSGSVTLERSKGQDLDVLCAKLAIWFSHWGDGEAEGRKRRDFCGEARKQKPENWKNTSQEVLESWLMTQIVEWFREVGRWTHIIAVPNAWSGSKEINLKYPLRGYSNYCGKSVKTLTFFHIPPGTWTPRKIHSDSLPCVWISLTPANMLKSMKCMKMRYWF